MTVSENVAFGLEMRKMANTKIGKRVAEALAMVQMTDRAEYKPNQLFRWTATTGGFGQGFGRKANLFAAR